jgi:Na+/H+-dicarboxylate symporter/ABC-type amino acid transport substrate-binding protein
MLGTDLVVASDLQNDRLFTHILWAIGAGILVGLFFGETIQPLGIVATGFIRLLQVNVLPYLLGSLILSLGSRGASEMRLLARYGIGLLLFVWGLTLLLVVASPLAFPAFSGAPVFGLEEPPPTIDWLDLYIPANLFHALANNLIPAVVLFGILAGVALGQMTGDKKATLLHALAAFNEAMARVSGMILRLTPYGLFAIAAVTAGELHFEDVLRLQLWFHFYAGGTLLITLWVLPSLVARLTDVSYGRFIGAMRGAIITAAAAGDALVVLPLIAESAKTVLSKQGASAESADRAVSVAVPLLYNFPHVGKILSLAFLPFAAWYSGSSLGLQQVLLLVTTGPLSLFGNINAAMPFMLDLLHLPADLFELFSISSILNSRFGAMTSAAHIAALGVVIAAAMMGAIHVSARQLLRYLLVTVALMGVFVIGTRAIFSWVLPPAPAGLSTLSSFALRPPLVAASVVSGTTPSQKPEVGRRLQAIKDRGALRVGYFDDAVPWAFVNASGTLVGYDVEAAHRLANQLAVRLEFVPLHRASTEPSVALTDGRIDILMTGFTATVSRAERMELSHSYSSEHVGFLVRDFDRRRFDTLASLNADEDIVIAIPPVEGAVEAVQSMLPRAQTRNYQAVEEALAEPAVTAMLTTLERAYYWSRVYPEYTAVRPQEVKAATIVVYALPYGELDFRNLVNLWIETRQANGESEEAYNYWVRGRALAARNPRWSVLANVLGWR